MAIGLDPVTAAIGIGGDIASAWYANRTAQNRQHEQMDFAQEQFAKRYQVQVKDLMAAGLNPMLAYGQSPGAGPQTSAAQVSKPDVGKAFNETRIATANVANLEAQTEVKREEANNIKHDTYLKRQSAEMNDDLWKKIKLEVINTEQQLENLKSEVAKNRSSIELNEAMAKTQAYLMHLYEMQAKLTQNNVNISNPAADAAQTWTGQAAAHGRNISDAISPVTDMMPRVRIQTEGKKYPKKVGD